MSLPVTIQNDDGFVVFESYTVYRCQLSGLVPDLEHRGYQLRLLRYICLGGREVRTSRNGPEDLRKVTLQSATMKGLDINNIAAQEVLQTLDARLNTYGKRQHTRRAEVSGRRCRF